MISDTPAATGAYNDAAAHCPYEQAVRDRRAWSLTHLIRELRGYNIAAQIAYDTENGLRAEFVYPKCDLGPITVRDNDDGNGEFFAWNTDTGMHPVCDPAGAARRIATARQGVRVSLGVEL